MASFPAHIVLERILPEQAPFSLRDITGAPRGEVGFDHLSLLAEAALVNGIGSNQRFRYFEMVVDDDEAARVLQQKSRDLCMTRARRPLDVLVRMMADRKFTRKRHVVVYRIQGGSEIASQRAIFEHK